MLRPHTPLEGTLKSPDTPQNPRVGARMKAAGQQVNIDFTGKCDRTPNTLLSHMLLSYCEKEKGFEAQNELQERLFQAYFTDGIFLDQNALLNIAETIGLDKENAKIALQSDVLKQEVIKEASKYAGSTSGVPFFLFNGRPAFSGAQDPQTFINVFQQL